MGRIGLPEVIVIFLIILILFGAKKLPEIGASIGKALREFRNAGKDAGDAKKDNEGKSNAKES